MTDTASHSKKMVAITRHANSLTVIEEYAQGLNVQFKGIVMDAAKQTPNDLQNALLQMEEELSEADVVIVATKVYNSKPEVSELSDLTKMMNAFGYLRDEATLVYTNLGEFSRKEIEDLRKIHPLSAFVENDNIGKNGMDNLNVPIRVALNMLPSDQPRFS
jgi:hypothetical protein